MASTKKTPAQVRDAKLKSLANARKAGQITASEYTSGVREAQISWANATKGAGAASKARTIIAAGDTVSGPAASALNVASKMKAPLQAAGKAAKFATNWKTAAVLTAAQIAGPWLMEQAKTKPGAKTSNASPIPSQAPKGSLMNAPKTATAGRTATNKPSGTQGPKTASSGLRNAPGASGAMSGLKKANRAKNTYTVKSGDNLSKIAAQNGTTVSALLKANPTIAARRKAGKVDIFSGSKVRLPGGKK